MNSKESTSDSSDSFVIQIMDESVNIKNDVEEEEDFLLKNNHFSQNNLHETSDTDLSMHNLEIINSIQDVLLYQQTRCDSPLTISNYGSKEGSCNSSDIEDAHITDSSNNLTTLSLDDISQLTKTNLNHVVNNNVMHKRRSTKFKKLDLYDVEKKINQYYCVDDIENRFTNEIDILTTYMKGQKNVYVQSKNITQWKYNCLMIPTLIISCFITISTPFIDCQHMRSSIVTGLNAIIAFLISVINFCKLESSTQSFFQLASQYDKLETILELTNGRLLVTDNDIDKKHIVIDKINEIEQKILEIKDTNQFLIPEEIKSLFPIICHVNIFSFIKKMQNYRHELTVNLCDIKNEIRYILHKWKKMNTKIYEHSDYFHSTEYKKENSRLDYLYKIKDKIKTDITDFKHAYSHLDELFTREIKLAENKTNRWGVWFICFWNYSQKTNNETIKKDSNPVINKYFHFIFNEDY